MLSNTVGLVFLLLQTLSFSAAVPSPMERDIKLVAMEEAGQTGRGDISYEKVDDYNPFKDDDKKYHDYSPFKDDDQKHHDCNPSKCCKGHSGGKYDDSKPTTITTTDQIPGPTMTITVTIDIEPTTCSTDLPFPTDCTTHTATVTAPPVTETDTITVTEVPGSVTRTETITQTETDTLTITEVPGSVTRTETITQTETDTITDTDTIIQTATVTQTTTEITTSTTTYCPTGTPTGGPDTGDCTPPTITYYPDRDPNQAFEIDDTGIYSHGPSALISTQTSFICNQLRSPCNAPESTVQYCLAAAESVDSSGLQGEAQAEYWNSFWT